MKPSYLTLDTKDDRREIWSLLHRLPPAARLAYLEKCCAAIRGLNRYGNGPVPAPGMRAMADEARRCGRADERLTNSVYLDLLQVAANMGLDLVRVALDLEALARRGQPAFAAADLVRR